MSPTIGFVCRSLARRRVGLFNVKFALEIALFGLLPLLISRDRSQSRAIVKADSCLTQFYAWFLVDGDCDKLLIWRFVAQADLSDSATDLVNNVCTAARTCPSAAMAAASTTAIPACISTLL